MSAATHEALERAIAAHIQDETTDEGRFAVTHWTLAGATIDADGTPGFFREDSGYLDMPIWQVQGLLMEAQRRIVAAGTAPE